MNDLHFYFTTARARYCFYYFIVNANKQKKRHSQHHTRNKSKNLSNKEMQESFVVGSEAYGVSLILLC